MNNYFKTLIHSQGILFTIERNGVSVSQSLGLLNHEKSTGKAYIGMLEDSHVLVGDWLITPHNDRFYIQDKKTDYVAGIFHQYKLFYLTETEYKNKSSDVATFHIENAYGSVIGTQSNVTLHYNDSIQKAKNQIDSTNSPDKQELQQIISLLEMVVNNQVPPQKGLFSKFSSVMERNSWITGTITSALLSWLTNQI